MYAEGVFDFYVYILERLPEHCIFRMNLGSGDQYLHCSRMDFYLKAIYLLNEETIFFRNFAVL